MSSRTKLMPHQKAGVKRIEKLKCRVLIADEMQLGKTIQALAYVKNHPELRPVVIVCPAISKEVWRSQAREHVNLRGRILSGQRPPKKKPLVKPSLLIINYEILTHWRKYLKKLNPKILIIDECHKMKNEERVRTKAILKLVKKTKKRKKIKRIMAISGTPLINRPIELWNTLHMLRPDIWHSKLEFAFKYCQPRLLYGKWKYDGASNLDDLHKQMKKHVMIRRLKKDILTELKVPVRIVVPLGIKKRKEYIEADTDLIKWLRKKNPTKAKRAVKAERLVRFGYLKRLAAKLKMKNVFKWIDNYLESTDEKIVIFAIHKNIVRKIHKRYKDISVVIDGSASSKKKKLAERSFKTNKKIKMLICNIQAAGESISLSKVCNVSAFIELGWTPGEHSQAEARNYGIGQTKGCLYYYLVAKDTIEEDLCKIIQKKQETLSAVLDGGKEMNTLNIYDELERTLRRRLKK